MVAIKYSRSIVIIGGCVSYTNIPGLPTLLPRLFIIKYSGPVRGLTSKLIPELAPLLNTALNMKKKDT